MKISLRLAAVALLAALSISLSLAGEDGNPSPEENYRRLSATFPAPGEEAAFSFEGRFIHRGKDIGSIRLGAEPIEDGGGKQWKTEDRLHLRLGKSKIDLSHVVRLDRHLTGLEGWQVKDQPLGVTRTHWWRTASGMGIATRSGDDENAAKRELGRDGEVLSSLSSIALLCRQAKEIGQSYALTVFDPNPSSGEEYFQPTTLTVQGPGPWRDRMAFLYSGVKGTQTMTLAFDEESRALLGFRIAEEGGMVIEILPPGEGPDPDPVEPGDTPSLPDDPVVETLTDPPATGLAVTVVVDGAQAKKLGVLPGDVLTNYDGVETPTLEALGKAKQAAEGKESVVLTFVRGPEALAINFAPGPVGVHLTPVVKGEPVKPLPPATPLAFDFTPLREGPHDTWHAFLLGDKKVGFEHGAVKMEDGRLIVRREVAFDGGEQWGLNHFVVDIEVTAEPIPVLLNSRFENPVTGWIGTGEMEHVKGDVYEWTFHWEFQGESGDRGAKVAKNTIPDYLVEVLALYMPRKKGACWHFRPVGTGYGDLSLPAALYCAGEVGLEHGGETVKAWAYEQHQLGGMVTGRYWVGRDGRMLFVDYNGAQGRLTTKEEALKDLSEDIVPRTAD